MEKEFLSSLPLTAEQIGVLSRYWELTQRSYPAEGVYFLQEAYLQKMAVEVSLCAEAVPVFMENGRRMREDEQLSRLAWACHWLLHVASPEIRKAGIPWLFSPKDCTFFAAIVKLAAYPWVRSWYQSHGIPERIMHDSLSVINVWTQDYREKHGCWGCCQGWPARHFIPDLFRLGRLEFEVSSFHSDFLIYRRKTTRELAMLAPAGLPLAADGFFCQPDQQPVLTTTLEETAEGIRGYAATANGRLASQPVTLAAGQWEKVIEKGDPVIGMHIPAIDPLTYDACKDSLAQAREFFPRYLPEFAFKGFACGSWLLDPTLQDILPPTANIVRFQSLFHLCPNPSGNDWQTRERVFGNPDLPLDQVPQRTSLQRLVREKILAGHRFRAGMMFLPRD